MGQARFPFSAPEFVLVRSSGGVGLQTPNMKPNGSRFQGMVLIAQTWAIPTARLKYVRADHGWPRSCSGNSRTDSPPYAGCSCRDVFIGIRASCSHEATTDTLRGSHMRGLKALLGTTALLAGLAMAPAAQAQIVINIGGAPPSCAYGYYGYAPYSCAPMGYYGSGYFYNGIFVGIGPWSGWGYSHGWGSHRFVADGGGRYHGGPGRVTSRASNNQARDHAAAPHAAERPSASHAAPARKSAPKARATASHASAPHASAARGGGGHSDADKH
jgi:hypothetical protein